MPFRNPHAISKHLLSQQGQSAIVVVSDIPERLIQFYADLCEGMAFEEVEPQSLSLIFR